MHPNIYSLFFYQIIGELGDRTQVQDFPVCPVCDLRIPPIFKKIDYCFDRWAGEDMVKAMGCYAVSQRLREAIIKAGIRGLSLKK